MVEGGFAWDFQKPLLTGRYGLKGVSLPDTIIMTGDKCCIQGLLKGAKLCLNPYFFGWLEK